MLKSKANLKKKALDDPAVERDVVVLLKKYLRGDALIDCLANIPFVVYTFVYGIPRDAVEIEEHTHDWLFNLVMAIKILRLFHYDEITDTITREMDILSEIFWRKTFLFENLLKWIKTGLEFMLSLHYFACGWILIHRIKLEAGHRLIEFTYNFDIYDYIESVYLITTTITTVGYGDFKAFHDETGHWLPEMLYLYFVTIFGIIMFSTVTREIFIYKKLKTVSKMVAEGTTAMEEYLNDVSRVMKDKALDE